MTASFTIRSALRNASRDDFESLVSDVLSGLLPGFSRSKRLGELDRQGIDARQFDYDGDRHKVVVQCKGFELPFGDDQLDQCLKEIDKYAKLGPDTEEYWLVLNRRVNEAQQKIVQEKANTLVVAGKASKAVVFDEKRFLYHLKGLARTSIGLWATERRMALEAAYKERLEVVSYIPNVPFSHQIDDLDPSVWITAKVRDYLASLSDGHYGRDLTPPRYLLTASFGFGKTSALHAIANQWAGGGGQVVYIPAALLPGQAFGSSATLTDALLDEIIPPDHAVVPLCALILRDAFRRDLAGAKNWLLLIDAIDECRNWQEHSALVSLWGSIIGLGLPVVVSVREELFAMRRQEFLYGDGRNPDRPFFEVLALQDWPTDLIGEFLGRYALARPVQPPPAFARFKTVVDEDSYNSIYGDIPKRPLFLGMLADDAWRGAEPEQDLHRLYGHYFRRKLHADRFSAGAEGKPVRDGVLSAELGMEEVTERMLWVMQAIAALMLEQGTTLATQIREGDLRREVLEIMGVYGKTEEVALNSLLQPAGRDPETGARVFRFAHQSFQEWFTARSLVARNVPPSEVKGSDAVKYFARKMSEDRDAGRGLP